MATSPSSGAFPATHPAEAIPSTVSTSRRWERATAARCFRDSITEWGAGKRGWLMKRVLAALLLLVLLVSGCNKERPSLAGGKPVRHWVEALKEPDVKRRKTAVNKLGNVGPAD